MTIGGRFTRVGETTICRGAAGVLAIAGLLLSAPGASASPAASAQVPSAPSTQLAGVAAADPAVEALLKEARALIDRGDAQAAIAKLSALVSPGAPGSSATPTVAAGTPAPGAASSSTTAPAAAATAAAAAAASSAAPAASGGGAGRGVGEGDLLRVRQMLGVAYYHADDYPRAVELLQQVRPQLAEDSVERRETEQVLGLALHLLGRDAEAIPWLERTRLWAADNLELNFVLGQAYIQTRQADRAREALARTFGVAPDSAAARVLAAQLMIRLQMEPLAEAELLAAIKQDPRVSRAHFLLGQLALFRGRLDEALAYSRTEIALNPADAMAFYQAGDALVRQAKWDEAIRLLQQSLWINPFYSGPYILLGRAYLKKEQPVTAEAMLRRAIAFDPNNRMAHYLLAQLLQQAGRDAEAKREFAEAERLQGQAGRP